MKLHALFLLGLLTSSLYAETECKYFAGDSKESGNYLLHSANAREVGFDPVKLERVDKTINNDIKHGFPGAGLLIIKDGKVLKQTVYGYKLKYDPKTLSPLAKPELVECNTLFDLASNTKMYATNYAIMHLVYESKLDIERPVSFYLPEYSGCDQNGQCRNTRTIRDLLTHRAGYMPDPQFFNPESIKKYGNNLYSQNHDLTESIIEHQLPFNTARNGNPNYSDIDFMLLGMVVEKITEMPLDQYVSKTIYQPLGLTNTMFNPLEHGVSVDACAATEINGNTRGGTIKFPNIRTRPVQCQVHDEKAYYSMAGVAGHAGLFSNLKDLAVLLQLALNNGSYGNVKLWDKKTEKEFVTPLDINDSYGLGWRRAGSKNSYKPLGRYTSNLAFGHTGWTGTLTLIDPKYNLAIVLLTNKKHSNYENGKFSGDNYATGKYYPIIDLVYDAMEQPSGSAKPY